MNKQTFIQLIKDPSGISPEQLLELEMVVGGFPYCQSAYILIAKQAAETGSMLADQKIKKAAAYTLDRKNLKKILYDIKDLSSSGSQKTILKELSSFTPIETTVDELRSNEEIQLIQEEKAAQEISKKEETSSIVSEELKPITREPLTDEKRDQIIRELQNLHTIKNKATWNEVPEALIISENSQLSEESLENNDSGSNDTHELSFVDEKKEQKEIEKKSTIENTSLALTYESNDVFARFNNNLSIHPIRTEDVVVEELEKEINSELLLEYIEFLEEKRSIFRKNKKKEGAIIAKIILDDPTIPKLDINNLPDNSVDLSSKSSTIFKGPVSENFAKILGLQGKKDKAIEIYEQLILKNPEKKPYFESQIEKLKNKI